MPHHAAAVILQVGMLLVSGNFDAASTNRLQARCQVAGTHFYEVNPMLRPFPGPSRYAAINIGDLTVYTTLLLRNKRRAAAFWAYGESASHLAMGLHNFSVHPATSFVVAPINPATAAAQAAANSATPAGSVAPPIVITTGH